MKMRATTSQTVGPFFQLGLQWLNCDDVAGEGVAGERVTVQGHVIDGDGVGVPDALVEVWQANAHGKYAHPDDRQDKPLEPGFRGYARIPTDQHGAFRFATIKPGPVPGPKGKEQAPHLVISIFMRGLLKRLTTRMYFPGDALLATDPILKLVEPARRTTLVAKNVGSGALQWNVLLQGSSETVFFDLGL
ncbi:MAG: protocatechuate 3,4-dioxygenase subunit alpha [Terriglobales bacterium]